MATFSVSFFMGMIGFVLGAVIWSGVRADLLALEADHALVAKVLGFLCLYGAAIVGGIYGLQKGARWTRLFSSQKMDF